MGIFPEVSEVSSPADTCSPLPNMFHKLSYSMEIARSTTTYSHAHSLNDGQQNYFISLSLVCCKAACLLCFIKGLRLGSIKEGPWCLVLASAAQVTQGEWEHGSSWGTGPWGRQDVRRGLACTLVQQTYSWEDSQAHLHSSLSSSRATAGTS